MDPQHTRHCRIFLLRSVVALYSCGERAGRARARTDSSPAADRPSRHRGVPEQRDRRSAPDRGEHCEVACLGPISGAHSQQPSGTGAARTRSRSRSDRPPAPCCRCHREISQSRPAHQTRLESAVFTPTWGLVELRRAEELRVRPCRVSRDEPACVSEVDRSQDAREVRTRSSHHAPSLGTRAVRCMAG